METYTSPPVLRRTPFLTLVLLIGALFVAIATSANRDAWFEVAVGAGVWAGLLSWAWIRGHRYVREITIDGDLVNATLHNGASFSFTRNDVAVVRSSDRNETVVVLNNGTTIRFGAHIARGDDLFKHFPEIGPPAAGGNWLVYAYTFGLVATSVVVLALGYVGFMLWATAVVVAVVFLMPAMLFAWFLAKSRGHHR